MRIYKDLFNEVIKPENLFLAWGRFRQGKQNKPGILAFEQNLEQNIFELHRDLKNKTYHHGAYVHFFITDPKRRSVHKATMRDRILHHAIFQVLICVFEPTFIPTSFSCRVGKGTHKGVRRTHNMLLQVSQNRTRACYALKCDVRKFFDTIDHSILLSIIRKKIKDPNLI